MAEDADTFNFLFNIVNAYRMQGGSVNGAFVDGTMGIENPQSSDWYCLSTHSDCGTTLPWRPGQPNDPGQQCINVFPGYHQGVANARCRFLKMVICKF